MSAWSSVLGKIWREGGEGGEGRGGREGRKGGRYTGNGDVCRLDDFSIFM